MIVVGVGGAVQIVAEVDQSRSAGVPVGDAVGGSFTEVEVSGGFGHFEKALEDFLFPAELLEAGLRESLEKFELFRIAAKHPGMATGPSGEGRVALLGGGATVGAIGDVEDGFVNDPARDVVGVASLAVIDVVACGGLGVLDRPGEKTDLAVVFPHQGLAEDVGETQSSERADGVGKERVGSVE